VFKIIRYLRWQRSSYLWPLVGETVLFLGTFYQDNIMLFFLRSPILTSSLLRTFALLSFIMKELDVIAARSVRKLSSSLKVFILKL
jgi:hypothetical protein